MNPNGPVPVVVSMLSTFTFNTNAGGIAVTIVNHPWSVGSSYPGIAGNINAQNYIGLMKLPATGGNWADATADMMNYNDNRIYVSGSYPIV